MERVDEEGTTGRRRAVMSWILILDKPKMNAS